MGLPRAVFARRALFPTPSLCSSWLTPELAQIVVSAIAIYWTTSPAPLSAQRAQPGSGVYGTSPSFAFRPGSGSGAQCTTVVVATTGADDVVDVRKTLLDEDACESPVRAEGKGLPDGEWEEGRMVSVELPKVPPPAKALW